MRNRKWTMREVLLIFCIGSVVIALLLQTVFFHQSLKRQIRTENIADYEVSLTKLQQDLSDFIFSLKTEMLTIYTERSLIDQLRKEADDPGQGSLKEHYWDCWYFARRRFSRDDRIQALYLYDARSQLISTYRINCVDYPKNIYHTEYDTNSKRVAEYIQSEETEMMVSGYYNPMAGKNLTRFVLKLHNYDEERRFIGYLVCDLDSYVLQHIMEKYVDVAQVCLWLQPLDDQVVAMTGDISENQSRIYRKLTKLIGSYYHTTELAQEYDDYYLIQVGQEEYNLEAFVLVSQSLLSAVQKSLLRSLVIIMAAMILTLVALVFLLSRWITRPVEEMRDSIVRIKNGETDLRVEPVGWSEELEVLGTEFNEMLDRIQTLVKEEYRRKLVVERTEYKMLQAQINPHFLYNTLDAMSGIANAQNCPLVSGMCHSLSAIFRYSMDMTDELSTVQKEMAHVRNYLYVTDVRNHSSVAFEYNIDSDTLMDRLPRICIQPIVENAITHGLRKVRRKDKKLSIRTEHREDILVVTVKDNGAGMDAEEMNLLLEKNDLRRVESGVSIGILNVNARLKRLFGQEYGLYIESSPGAGTTVTMKVPAISEEGSSDRGGN